MKQLMIFLAAIVLLTALTACGNDTSSASEEAGNNSTSEPQTTTAKTEAQSSAGESSVAAESGAAESKGETAATGALPLLNAVWESYAEDEKFPATGGDFSDENAVSNAPGKYSLDDAAALDSVLGLPADAAAKVKDIATLIHMMNANTFTGAAYQVGDAADAKPLADALKDSIQKRQWLCGFPDKLVISAVDNVVVAAFGNEELIDTFQTRLTAAYDTTKLLYDEPIL